MIYTYLHTGGCEDVFFLSDKEFKTGDIVSSKYISYPDGTKAEPHSEVKCYSCGGYIKETPKLKE